MKQPGIINIRNQSPAAATIDIEGTIGVPEEWQFDQPDDRVATYEKFRNAITEIQTLECDHVRVNIRSTGGNLNDAMLIYEALCALPASVETHCYGYVASAATVVAQAASVGQRYVSSGSLYLIHNSRTTVDGTKELAILTADLLSKTDQQVAQIYAGRSQMAVETFVTLMNLCSGEGQWLTPDEALGYGLADKIEKANPLDKIGRKIKNFFSTIADTTVNELPSTVGGSDVAPNDRVTMSAEQIQGLLEQNRQLKEQIQTLRVSNRRIQALPTATKRCEDPATEREIYGSKAERNQKSYVMDMENFQI